MKKFCKYCQEQTDHFGDECLECLDCYSSSESEDELSEHESDIEFINDDSESDYKSESEDESNMVKSSNVIQAKNGRSLFFRKGYESESEEDSEMEY